MEMGSSSNRASRGSSLNNSILHRVSLLEHLKVKLGGVLEVLLEPAPKLGASI
jgi:hypothetical protein